ncbi:uncharacterized protein LOC110906839 [Helianthus annuus]|uniref:uncharacterized protein LOC110906839 n=1 Tax=Helianthus annuus TaxID=4232 RepID=UPI000B8FB154|nr:uncharacterized protein LOC110906839 [Helianthus annuus]
MEVLRNVSLSSEKDKWYWFDDKQFGFSVKSVKKSLTAERETSHPPNFIWCKWLPIKYNIMAWRGNLDRLPTRVNLRRKNVDIPSVLCPLYNDYEETVDHLFTTCSVALQVWSVFSVWCNIPLLFFFEFKDILESHKLIKSGKKAEKIIYRLGIIACWCIWKGRNDTIFNQRKCSSSDIIREFKSRGYAWVKNRTSCKYIIWADWCKYPLYML